MTDRALAADAVAACDIGFTVRRLRQEAGLSQHELARRSATSQPAVAHLEAGRRVPTLATLEKLAAALGRDLLVMLPARRNAPAAAAEPGSVEGDQGSAWSERSETANA